MGISDMGILDADGEEATVGAVTAIGGIRQLAYSDPAMVLAFRRTAVTIPHTVSVFHRIRMATHRTIRCIAQATFHPLLGAAVTIRVAW